MTTTYYYVSYGKPPRPPLWRYVLLGLLLLLAVGLASGIGYGIYELATGGGGQAPTATAPPDDIAPNLQGTLSRMSNDSTSGYILVENSLSAAQIAPEALVNFVNTENGQWLSSSVQLVPFADGSGHPIPPEYALESGATPEKWLKTIAALPRRDRPDYIYDTVADAHRDLVKLGDSDKDNTIILITDGLDGGYAVFDIEAIGPCPSEVLEDPGDVCGPMLETVVADVDQLVPCPLALGAPPDFVCHPKSAVGADDAVIVYDPLHPESLMPCPPEVGGAGAICYDSVVDYLPFSREAIDICPPELDASPGKACAELRSKTTEEELLAMINDSPVPNLRVHVIGLGDRDDHDFLRQLAVVGNGEYIYCSARGCESP